MTTTQKPLTKTQRAAQKAKAAGYRFVATVVKQVFNTTYYRVHEINNVIARGWYAGHPLQEFVHLKLGLRFDELPEKTILRTAMLAKFGKGK